MREAVHTAEAEEALRRLQRLPAEEVVVDLLPGRAAAAEQQQGPLRQRAGEQEGRERCVQRPRRRADADAAREPAAAARDRRLL